MLMVVIFYFLTLVPRDTGMPLPESVRPTGAAPMTVLVLCALYLYVSWVLLSTLGADLWRP
jgi:hypothetical protein